MKLSKLVFISFLICMNAFTVKAQESSNTYSATYIEHELNYLMSIWPGDYDNLEQISFDARAKFNKPLGEGRFHATVSPIDASSIGENLLYIETSSDGDLDNTYQQRLYKLIPDEALRAIRIKAFAFKKPSKYLVSGKSADKFNGLQLSNLIALEGCDLLVRRNNDTFVGSNTSGTCQDVEKPGYLERNIRISKDQYSFNDQRYINFGKQLLISTFTARKMNRAKWFSCKVDVPKGAQGLADFAQHHVKIHDQGDSFSFTHPDGRTMVLQLRNTWSYDMQGEAFSLTVFEQDLSGKLLINTWSAPSAERIGMKSGYIRVQCDHAAY